MEEKDKELLLKDLCARLPYGVIVEIQLVNAPRAKYPVLKVLQSHMLSDFMQTIENVIHKPYLRPMSSMTEDERKQLSEYIFSEKGRRYFTIQSNGILYSGIDNLCFIGLGDDTIDRLIDWLNEHHFDVRNLIEKNLALEAPSGMYKK